MDDIECSGGHGDARETAGAWTVGNFLEYTRGAAARVQHDLQATAPGEWAVTADETGGVEVTHDGRSAAGAITVPGGEDLASLSEGRVTQLVAVEVQRLVGVGIWPFCSFHWPKVLFPALDEWECLATSPSHAVARIGSLSSDRKDMRTAPRKPLLRRTSADFLVVYPPRSFLQWLVAGVTIYTVTRPLPGRPFTGVKVPFLPLGLHQPVYAIALILLSMTPIDCIVGLPLGLGWAGVLTLGQAAAAVALALMAHACYSPSVLRLLAPRSAPDPGKWADDNLKARVVIRTWLLTLPILLLVYATPALFTECRRWAAHHNADPVMLFTTICTGGCALVTAVIRVARSRWNLGDRDADDLFREMFWALLAVSLAFLPAAFRADWAPTLFGGLAVPLIITRARITAAQAVESQAERSAH